MSEKLKVGILGGTGMVGQRFISLLENHPWFEVTTIAASPRSAGKTYEEAVGDRWKMDTPMPEAVKKIVVMNVNEVEKVAAEVDFVFSAVDMTKEEIKKIEEEYAKTETPVVSNNSAHRWTPDVPMVVPEINPEHFDVIESQKKRLGTTRGFIAVKPNCSIQSYAPVLTAWKEFEPYEVVATTYQAISGAGKTFKDWPEMVGNIIPFIGGEEEKSEQEPLRVLGKVESGEIVKAELPKITCQCVRVPVLNGHTAAVFINFEKKPTKEQLIEKLESFKGFPQEAGLPSAPKHFIRYMEQLEKYDVDYGEADTLDENADVVRIMSIHKSKGLEFPVVFVSGLSKRFNMQDANQSLIVDMDLGVAVDYVDSGRRIKNKTLRRAVLSAKMKEDNLAEELRVLYVALTRAREKLILTAVLDKAEEKWELSRMTGQEKLTYLDFCEAGSYMDFLLPILPKTGIAVTTLGTEDLVAEEIREQLRMGDRRELLQRVTDGETPLPGDPEENERKLAKLRERFAYAYPYPGLQKLYTKTTVSELKIAAMAEKDEAAFHTFEEKEVVPYIPAFRREQEKVSGAVRGNAFHRTMELLDFSYLFMESGLFAGCPGTYEEYRQGLDTDRLQVRLKEFLQRETASLRLTEEYAQAVSLPKIRHFLEQELAYRMWRAFEQGLLYREQPFVLGIDAKRLDQDLPEGEKVLIQGIIDVFFIENGEIVLLDYKTDVIDSLQALWNRYSVQIQYYEEALTKLMQLPVKERILYSFYLEKYE